MASTLRTITWRQRAVRLQFLRRQLGHRAQTLLQRQPVRHTAERFHCLDPLDSAAGAAPRSFRRQTVPATARHLDHAPEHAFSFQPGLGNASLRTGRVTPASGERLPSYGESVDYGADGRAGFLAPAVTARCAF